MLHVYTIDELWPDQLSRGHFPCGSDSKREGSLGMGLHTVGVKKFPFTVHTTGRVIPFRFHSVPV